MSSLLRGTRLLLSHSLRKIVHVASSRGHPRIYRDHLPWASLAFTRNLSTDVAPDLVSSTEASDAVSMQPVERLSDVQRRLELMDSNVRWRGRIDREDVESVLALIKRAETISDQQALMLLRCAGSLMVKESPSKRMEIFSDIWETLKKKGVVLRTSHYNAAIRVQLENKQSFVATNILAEMESSDDAKPNRVTFQLLVERYCQDGELDGATTILQHMKTQNLPVTEVIFNQLIVGHLKNGDAEGTTKVLESMRASGLRPSRETYKAMLCCHAEKGDVDAIEQTLSEAEQEEIHLPASHLYAVVIAFADSGHHDNIQQMLTHIKPGANHDALNTVHQLIARGHDEIAIQVYSHMSMDNYGPDPTHTGARAVLRTMILNDRPIEKLQSALASLKATGHLVDDNIDIVTLMALSYEKPEVALAGIKLMKESEMPVRPHVFWPILIQYAAAKNIDGMYNTVALLVETADKNEDYIPTLYKAFKPLLYHLKDTTAVSKLQEAGVKTEDINTIQLIHLLSSGSLTEAQEFLDSGLALTFHNDAFKAAFVSAAGASSDWTAFCKVASQLQDRSLDGHGFFSGIVLNTLLFRRYASKQDAIDIAQAWVDQSLAINSLSVTIAQRLLNNTGAPDSLIQNLSDAAIPDNTQMLEPTQVKALSVDELEAELKTRRPRDRDINAIRKQLLNKYCFAGDVERADALKSSLEKKNFMFDAPTLRQLGYLAAAYKKDLSEALMYKQQMEANHPDFSQYQQLVLNIASLQAEKGQFADAMKTLIEYGKVHAEAIESQQSERNRFNNIKDVTTLLKKFRAGATPAEVRDLVDVLFKYSFTIPGLYDALVEVVSAYISKNDMDGLMDVLKLYYHEYERVPNFENVFRTLITQKDAEKLEQVVDMVTNIKGSVAVLLKLAIACIDCQQPSKAAKIIGTPGLRANMNVLKTGMDEYVRSGKEKELRDLIDVTRDLFGVDREEMLFGLVRFYGFQKNADGCQSVLDLYDEQNIVPAPRTLRYIANVFTSQGKEVHFEVPALIRTDDIKDVMENRTESREMGARPTASNELEKQAMTAAQAGDVDDVILAFNTTGEQQISLEFLCHITRQLHRNHDGRNFRKFLRALREDQLLFIADDASIAKVMKSLAKKELLFRYIMGEVDNAEKKAAILDEIEASPGLVHLYFTSNMFLKAIHEADPELFKRVVVLIHQQLEKFPQNARAPQALFEYYIDNNMDGDAEELHARTIEFQQRVKMNVPAKILQNVARESKDETRLLWLLNLAKETSARKSATVYSYLVALRSETDLQGALQAVEDARADGLEYTDLFIPIMRTLEEKLTTANVKVPWPPGIFAEKQLLGDAGH